MSTEQHIHTNPLINPTYIKGTEHRLSIIISNHNLVNSVIYTWFPTFRRVTDMTMDSMVPKHWRPMARDKARWWRVAAPLREVP